MDIKSLNLFFGRPPDKDFLEDLEILKKFGEKEIIKLTDWLIETYPKENFDDEWKKLSKNLKDKEKKEKIITLSLFIFKQFAVGHINEIELKEDFEVLEIPQKYFDYFVKKISESQDFRKKALRQKQPYRNFLSSIDWRIDKQNYGHNFGENICVLEFAYYSKGKEEAAQFELSLEGIRNLKAIINKIEEKLSGLK